MPLQYPLYSISFAVAAVLVIGAATQAWQLREEPGGRPLVVGLLGMGFWASCEFAVTVVPGTPLSVVFMKLWFVGISVVIASVFVFVLAYTGYDQYVTRRTVGALTVWPVVFNLIVWLRPDLVWESFVANPATGTGWETTYGVAFGLHIGYSYLLVAVATFLLVRFVLTSQFLYQKQAAALLVGILAPWLTDIAYITRTISYDLTAVGFAVTGISLTWGIQRTKFMDVAPIARHTVVETLHSAVFVTNRENRLVDANQQGLELLDLSQTDIGRPVAELIKSFPSVAEQFQAVATATDHRSIRMELDDHYYKIELTPLYDDREYLVGRVFLVHEVTDQHRQQTRLQQQNKQLDQFASVVSHDLRNPLNVAASYAGLARKTGETAHFDKVQQAHQRMEQLIDELLMLARLDEATVDTTTVDLASCVRTAWQHVETDDAELTVEAETHIEANRQYLLQLLENLIRNSVEHSATGSRAKPDDSEAHSELTITITVRETETDGGVQLVVSDDGPGIPPADRESVLEEGYTTGDGTGLGLAIVTRIADVHDWAVSVESSDMGGAAFVFDGVDRSTPAES
jgi:signal transduction histidine kinase